MQMGEAGGRPQECAPVGRARQTGASKQDASGQVRADAKPRRPSGLKLSDAKKKFNHFKSDQLGRGLLDARARPTCLIRSIRRESAARGRRRRHSIDSPGPRLAFFGGTKQASRRASERASEADGSWAKPRQAPRLLIRNSHSRLARGAGGLGQAQGVAGAA